MRAGELPNGLPLRRRLQSIARNVPVTVGIGALVLWFMAAGAVDRRVHSSLLRHLALSSHDVGGLRLWRLPTSQLVQSQVGFGLPLFVGLLTALALAERRFDSKATVALFCPGSWASTLAVLVAARLLAVHGVAAAVRHLRTRDSGSSSGTWSTLAALAMRSGRGRWRRLTAIGAVTGFLVVAVVVHRQVADVQHLLAVAAGMALICQLRPSGAAMIVGFDGSPLRWKACQHRPRDALRRSRSG